MKRGKRWLLVSAALLLVLVSQTEAAQPFKKVSLATTTKPTTTTTATAAAVSSEADATTPEAAPTAAAAVAEEYSLANDPKSENAALKAAAAAAAAKNSSLTGIPQIDYIWDPNLPRELRGYNLSNYPFYSVVPEDQEIHFECEGHHDGFYASIEHKCQLYHHCVYGIRHDFLCANFTAFDQKTFICHFVSDVDCDNSYKYWSRNDDLYMATTTTAKPTTSTEEPPPPRNRPYLRPNRPLRRPGNRRPLDDYYYEEEEYDDEYYEERLNRRRKQRPRKRKPIVMDYEDEYEDEKRSLSDEEKPLRRPSTRDRQRAPADEQDAEDYDVERPKTVDRPKTRSKLTPAPSSADRRKLIGRKPGSIGSRPTADERRSFNDDRPTGRKNKPTPVVADESEESEESPVPPPRRLHGARRRIGEKRTSAAPAVDADDEEKLSHAADPDETAEEEQSSAKDKTTPKPLEEFVTPKAVGSSVYARPRAPPRIALPVPVNEKKKFQYPVQKSSATTASAAVHADGEEEYYEEELDEEPVIRKAAKGRRRPQAAAQLDDDDDLPPITRRRGAQSDHSARKPTRTTLRKPVTDKKLGDDDAEYDSAGASNERQDSRTSARKRPFNSRNRGAFSSARGAEDVDFVDDDYEERPLRPAHRLRPNKLQRKDLKKQRPLTVDEEDEAPLDEHEPARPLRSRAPAAALPPVPRRKNIVTSQRLRQSTVAPLLDEVAAADTEEDLEEPEGLPAKNNLFAGRQNAVRVVKRPFLPSRGGSPYLPRGLQPVGVALKSQSSPQTTASTPIDMGSTISGVRLLEHGAPILRDSVAAQEPQRSGPTLPPREQPLPPKVTLDELYENDYDVTLNDALNPTLKPLTSSNHRRNYPPSAFASTSADASAFIVNNKQSPAFHQHNTNNNDYLNQDHLNVYQTVPHSSASSSPSASSSSSSSSQTHLNHQSHQQQQQLLQQQQHQLQPQPQQLLSNYNSDSYFSSTDNRRRTINPASPARSSRNDYRGVSARIAQHFYDDLEY